MDDLPNTVAGPPAAPPMPPNLTRRQENFARCVAVGMSYSQAFREAGCLASTPGSRHAQIGELTRNPKVRRRVAELRERADAETVSTIAARMSWLRLVITADPAEISRVVHDPCGMCWTDQTIAAAYAAHFSPSEFAESRPSPPDVTEPRENCDACQGEGRLRVVLSSTDSLSPAARALFKGAKQNEKGEIEVQMHDQLAAAEMLNKLQGAYVTRSLNMNANVAIQAARDADPAEALRLFDAFGAQT